MGGRGSRLLNKHINNNDNRQESSPKYIDDPESELHNDMFKKLKEINFSTRESTDNIDDIVLKRQQEQILNIGSKYKKLFKNVCKSQDIQFAVENTDGMVLGYCQTSIINGEITQRIVLDRKQLANYDKITETVERGVREKWFAPINLMFKSRDYIITHELGHSIENSIIVGRHKTDSKMSLREHWANEGQKIFNDVVKIYKEKYTNGQKDDKIFLSKYSKTNYAEWFAETFCNMELSSEPLPIAKALKEYLGRYINED